jgi:hypothetical protein
MSGTVTPNTTQGTQNTIVTNSLPAFPWVTGNKLYAVDLNNAFLVLQNQFTNYAKILASLQQQLLNVNLNPETFNFTFTPGSVIIPGEYKLIFNNAVAQNIVSLVYNVGNAGGSFDAQVVNNGSAVGGLSDVIVDSSTNNSAPATSNQLVQAGTDVVVIISNITGNPTNWALSLNTTPVQSKVTVYVDLTDETGNPITDENGNPITSYVVMGGS